MRAQPEGSRPEQVVPLRLVTEARVRDLLPDGGSRREEASGVLVMGDQLLIIFDDATSIGVVGTDLTQVNGNHTIVPEPSVAAGRHAGGGYEDIARDPESGLLFLLVEAVRRGNGFMARVEELDSSYRRVSAGWLPFPLETENKGLEGLTFSRRLGEDHLLALCEGNRCRSGTAGEQPGGGRIQLFRRGVSEWEHADTIKLPPQVRFIDYSSISIRGERVAVVSQRSSALWVADLVPDNWQFADAGDTYEFPRDAGGEIVYGTVEGVSWLDDDHVVVVSDRADSSQPAWRTKHRSVHIFAIPGGA